MPTPPPDDWMQAAAQHSQEQFAGNVKRLDKQARRGNRLLGGCMMFFGLLAVALGILSLATHASGEGFRDTNRAINGIVWCILGGGATIGTGWFIWQHRRESSAKKIQNLGGLDVSDFLRRPPPPMS